MHTVWLVDALAADAITALRSCLVLFGNILTFAEVQHGAADNCPNVAIALVNRSTATVQLQASFTCVLGRARIILT